MFRVCILAALSGCASAAPAARPAAYETELVVCNRTARSMYESIACENDVRARYGRPRRPFPGEAPR